MLASLSWAVTGTGFTFLMTALGSALVFLFRGSIRPGVQRIFLGLAAGIMIAASVWTLLIPAIEEAQALGGSGLVPAAGGFALGVGFLMLMDCLDASDEGTLPGYDQVDVKSRGLAETCGVDVIKG